MTKPNFTHIVALLDRSGSMAHIKNDVIGGFNNFIEEQKQVPGEATLTLVQFSNTTEIVFNDVPLLNVAPLTPETYKIGGSTALNDALANTINVVGRKLAEKPENERPSRVVFLIMTDGQENASIKFGGPAGQANLKGMVAHQTEKYSWQFVFIGANIDAFAVAESYGVLRGNAVNYTSSSIGQQNAFKSVSRGVVASRLSQDPQIHSEFFSLDKALGGGNYNTVPSTKVDTTDIQATIDKYLNQTATPKTTPDPPSTDTPAPASTPETK